MPAGAFNYIPGTGEVTGEALWRHPGVDGVVFTGSKAVGMRIFHGLSHQWVKPCLLEMGGKNATIVLDSADLDAAAEGVTRSAFGLQNQKCSATSRVYVHTRVAKPFLEKLVEKTKALKIGDPTTRDVSFGPVINAAAVARFEEAVSQARREGTVVLGDQRGGTLGYPTANLSVPPELLVPGYGIYAGSALGHRAAISIGVNPHYGGGERRIEPHLLDFAGDLYGRRLVVELWERLREERAFSSEDELVAQIARDVEQTRTAKRPG